ncbi:ComEC/Rec2 family competence protein [Nocardia bhagyanarayanae]|uniref:Competence protein ComEC n=1 Tax=Nocardia bhagyanarayanae TaxID=1215925 RepID=A0A543EVP1_9NOCA|nr:ComEC/Rec2 family competence protein [Nocardia bhagyanarayanae]TQM25639.1 competence protein ComEC [Nocardia bhagyanarayanae]
MSSSLDAREPASAERAQIMDARLLPAALCCWAVTIVVLGSGWLVGIAVALGSAVAAAGSAMVSRQGRFARAKVHRAVASTLLAAVLFGAGFALAAAWREYRVASHPMREAYGLSLRIVVTPTDDPKPLPSNTFGAERRWVVRAALREYHRAEATVRSGGRVVVFASGPEWADLLPGQPIEFRAQPQPPKNRDLTVAALHALGPPKPVAPPPWWQRAAASVRDDFADTATAVLPPDAAGLIPALVLGDTSGLPEPVREDFETAGLQHLCVVSGANFTILLTVVLFVVRTLTLGPRAAATAATAALVMFVVVARPDPSVLRAAAMGAITLLALVTGRRKQALPALCVAVIGLLLVWPELAVNAGFALSVLATAGLILLAPSWADWLRARGWWRLPAEVVAVSAAAFTVTVPIMVALTGRISVVAILANVLVAPVIAPLTVIGALGAACASVWPPVAELVLRCAGPPLWWLLTVAERTAALPGATITVPGGSIGGLTAAAFVIVAVCALRVAPIRRIAAVIVLSSTAVLLPVRLWNPGWPAPDWVLAACDIGQGDGLALSVGHGTAVVIDVGPDPRTMRTCLDRLHIHHIALLALTHPHADHIGGLTGAIHGRTVAAIATAPGELDEVGLSARAAVSSNAETARHHRTSSEEARPGAAVPDPGDCCSGGSAGRPAATPHTWSEHRSEATIGIDEGDNPAPSQRSRTPDDRTPITAPAQITEIAARAEIPLLELSAGHVMQFGPVELTVLSPAATHPRPRHPTDEPNDRSLVLTATTPAGRILLTGDIESPAQHRLLRNPTPLRADILKVPHHGSQTTTKEFLTAVHPRLAIISSGPDNTFGHPHPAILTALHSLGTTIARTDQHGDILIAGTPTHLRIHTRPG